jgi:hypothetical protein
MLAMASCAEFEADEADLAAVAAQHWPGATALHRGELPDGAGDVFSIAYLATVRRDGGPRVHPFCPILAGGRLLPPFRAPHQRVGICAQFADRHRLSKMRPVTGRRQDAARSLACDVDEEHASRKINALAIASTGAPA